MARAGVTFFYQSGTSMSTPLVAGAAALMMEVNPTIKPALAKVLLQYTATPLSGYNMLEQGAGQLNVAGALKIADLVRRDLSATTTVGSPLLTAAARRRRRHLIRPMAGPGVTFDFTRYR
jgi:subtilisin family serine protease